MQSTLLALMRDVGQFDAFLTQPDENLAHTPEIPELLEYETDSGLHTPVGLLRKSATRLDPEADCYSLEQLATARFETDRLARALAEGGELHLAQRPLHTEQEPVVG